MPNRKAKQRKRAKMLKRKSIAEYKSKKRRERKDARKKKKFPYYKRIRTREGLIVEKVANKKDEKRLKEYFPESFENNK